MALATPASGDTDQDGWTRESRRDQHPTEEKMRAFALCAVVEAAPAPRIGLDKDSLAIPNARRHGLGSAPHAPHKGYQALASTRPRPRSWGSLWLTTWRRQSQMRSLKCDARPSNRWYRQNRKSL